MSIDGIVSTLVWASWVQSAHQCSDISGSVLVHDEHGRLLCRGFWRAT